MVAGFGPMGIAPIMYDACTAKGSIDDKISKAKEKTNNYLKHKVARVGVLAAGAGGAYAVNKFADKSIITATGNYLNNGVKWLGSKVSKDPMGSKINKDWITKLVDKFEKVPTKYKLMAGVALATLGVMGLISNHKNYKAGKIDQKYEDRAKIQEHFINVI